ncbi:MAG: TRAP transporter substrate-binding protein [Deltaproteobacteria bacterium]|jgi:TRAP-type mannitol/chloroaromatic compound transport system substrate-binding protein|nr:TRAP transporter substrate-binding protein [Deltaproteobacteria bacterium]MBT4090380.1 TRAP transporter substrate-binding protein [Deltaproteobacteria bacterium]MBT4265365.1 TRAP transporter substrate-binding protein [Deltaproteobacteria bacterium]MBT4644377.1 TRAP transporter substrate-binding protein [Deltaproteobacteria bacterium]MBT6501145.1 TRAP transporter substrate-binding protein [Deltaproteobacteria bacterium]
MKRRDFVKTGAVGLGGIALASGVSAPVVAKSRLNIAMVSTWPRDFPGLGTGAQRFAKRLSDMTDGRMKVNYYAANERVKAFDSFDEVASGNAQMYHAAEYYWKGKHPSFAYFTAVPFGMTVLEINAWMRFGGGQELWDELGAAYGVKGLMCGNTGSQMGGWFRKEINTAADMKGLKFRMPGLGGDVLAKMGVSPVSIPGGQIYENLISGAIDATEWVGPWNDTFFKFYEAAKYYYYPGMHEPGSMLGLGINKKWWDKLSKSDQLIIEAASSMENDVMMAEFNSKNGAALKKLVTEQGVKLRKFSDDIYDSFGEAAEEVFEEIQKHSPLAKRVHQSFVKSRAETGAWAKISDEAYLAQRNRVLGI